LVRSGGSENNALNDTGQEVEDRDREIDLGRFKIVGEGGARIAKACKDERYGVTDERTERIHANEKAEAAPVAIPSLEAHLGIKDLKDSSRDSEHDNRDKHVEIQRTIFVDGTDEQEHYEVEQTHQPIKRR